MSTPHTPKLTKKQKKGIAFRERKQGKGSKNKNGDDIDREGAGGEIPIEENQDLALLQSTEVEDRELAHAKTSKGKGKSSEDNSGQVAASGDTGLVEKSKKRKREAGEAISEEGGKERQKRRRKASAGGPAVGSKIASSATKGKGKL